MVIDPEDASLEPACATKGEQPRNACLELLDHPDLTIPTTPPEEETATKCESPGLRYLIASNIDEGDFVCAFAPLVLQQPFAVCLDC